MRAELRDGLEFLYLDSMIRRKPCLALTTDVARGAFASVHILLNDCPQVGSLRVRVTRQGRRVAEAQCFRLIDVPVEVNTGPVGFIEREGEHNPHVARRAPFRVYDAMEPFEGQVKATASTMAIRLQLPIAAAAKAGEKSYLIQLEADQSSVSLSWTVVIHKAVVPFVGRDTIPYTNWFSLDVMADRHGIELWSQKHWAMIKKYAALMAHGRQNTFWVPLQTIFSLQGGVPVLDRKKLKKYVKIFTDAGMHYIEGGHVGHRTGGDWNAETFDLALVGNRATSVAGNASLQCICSQLMDEIERNDWRDRWIQHVTDEPTVGNATDYRLLAGMVRRHMPGIPILDATMELSIAGSVDYWCPQCQEYEGHKKSFEMQRSLGDQVWYYTCCFPWGPWLNRLLDQELLRPALFGWAMALYDLDGYLHWGLNHYKEDQDPFEKSVVSHGGENCLPAGDTHIVYPGKKGPLSSVRLEAQREGFEDFELLKRLREKDPKTAQGIIRKGIRRFDSYTKNTSTFRVAKKAMLEAQEKGQ